MPSEPLVSVVTPLFNSASFVAETLESLQRQSYVRWECILVDDGSTDGTPKAVEPYLTDSRFRYIRQANRGIAGARNTALELAAGEWICLLDHDDRWLPGKLAAQVEAAGSGSSEIVFTDAWIVTGLERLRYSDVVGRDRILELTRADAPRDAAVRLFLAENPICSASAMFSARLRELGPFDPEVVPADDYDLWLRAIAAGAGVRFVDEPLAEYAVHEGNYSRDVPRLWRSTVLALEKNRPAFPSHEAELDAALTRRRRLYLTVLLQRRDWSAVAHELARIVRTDRSLRSAVVALPLREIAESARSRAVRLLERARASG